MAFPASLVTEQKLLTFLKLHPEIEKLLSKEA